MKKTKLSHLLYAEEMRALTLATMQEHIEAWDFERAMYWQLRYLSHRDEFLAMLDRHRTEYWKLRFAVIGEKF
jgi:hypothetical protein